jgi:hypothetical protein
MPKRSAPSRDRIQAPPRPPRRARVRLIGQMLSEDRRRDRAREQPSVAVERRPVSSSGSPESATSAVPSFQLCPIDGAAPSRQERGFSEAGDVRHLKVGWATQRPGPGPWKTRAPDRHPTPLPQGSNAHRALRFGAHRACLARPHQGHQASSHPPHTHTPRPVLTPRRAPVPRSRAPGFATCKARSRGGSGPGRGGRGSGPAGPSLTTTPFPTLCQRAPHSYRTPPISELNSANS